MHLCQRRLEKKILATIFTSICLCRLVSSAKQMLYVYFSLYKEKWYTHTRTTSDAKQLQTSSSICPWFSLHLSHSCWQSQWRLCSFLQVFPSFESKTTKKRNNNNGISISNRSEASAREICAMCMCSMNNTNKRLDYGINFQHITPTICIVLNKYSLCKWICSAEEEEAEKWHISFSVFSLPFGWNFSRSLTDTVCVYFSFATAMCHRMLLALVSWQW